MGAAVIEPAARAAIATAVAVRLGEMLQLWGWKRCYGWPWSTHIADGRQMSKSLFKDNRLLKIIGTDNLCERDYLEPLCCCEWLQMPSCKFYKWYLIWPWWRWPWNYYFLFYSWGHFSLGRLSGWSKVASLLSVRQSLAQIYPSLYKATSRKIFKGGE